MRNSGLRKVVLAVFVFMLFSACAWAQSRVTWTVQRSSAAKAVTAGDKFEIQVIAEVEEGWHIYDPKQPEEVNAPTRISLPPGQPFKLAGEVSAPEPKVVPSGSTQLLTHEGRVVLTVPVQLDAATSAGKHKLLVNVGYQTCNEEMCLPPTAESLELEIAVAAKQKPAGKK